MWCVCGHTCAMAHAWRTEDNSKNQVSPFNVWVPGILEGHNGFQVPLPAEPTHCS